MAIPQEKLIDSSKSFTREAVTASVAKSLGRKTAFLCHSHIDRELVKGLIRLFRDSGWNVYIDWLDEEMPDKPNDETARKLKQHIRDCNALIFLATENSMTSRWCPWEIGYCDCAKTPERVYIVPTSKGYSSYGAEYLDLYQKIDIFNGDVVGVMKPGERGFTRLSNVNI